MINNFKHLLLYIYIFSLLLSMYGTKFINININIEFLNFIKDEILIVDFLFYFSILYFKQILKK